MTKIQKTALRLAAAVLGSVALLLPVTISSGTGSVPTLAPNDACASENCCFELGSVCELDGATLTHYRDGRTCSDT